MFSKLWLHRKRLVFAGLVLGLLLVMGAVVFAYQVFDRVGIGAKPSSRGEQLRVRGQTIFGIAGAIPGTITFMPPDGTGFYHIDNPGGQKLRISGGSTPGQFEYITIGHPGKVIIRGDLHVVGKLFSQGRAVQDQLGSARRKISTIDLKTGGKADGADIEAIWANLSRIEKKLNELIKELNAR